MTFSEFKNKFYKRVPNLELFDVPNENLNLLKVVLDGLKVDYVKRGKVRPYMLWSNPLFCIYTRLKRFQSKSISVDFFQEIDKLTKSKIIIDNGRVVKDHSGNNKSVYFGRIESMFSQKELIIVNEKSLGTQLSDNQLNFSLFVLMYQNDKLTKQENSLRKKLKQTFKSIEKATIFDENELKNIKFAIHKFYFEYIIWKRALSEFPNLKKAFFVCHYHKEGLILALKRANIQCIELQHGLIAEQDIFYVFPAQVKVIKDKSLFADELWVYGTYWKNVVLKGTEYNSNQIKTIGYYLFENKVENLPTTELPESDKVVVITTQTFLHKEFIDFTTRLYENHAAIGIKLTILVKPHPAEDASIYIEAFQEFEDIIVVTMPINELFSRFKIHISVYSTTLFDALRYGVKNYVFMVSQCSDYVNGILDAKIATLLDENFDNFEIVLVNDKIINSKNYYDLLNKDLLIS